MYQEKGYQTVSVEIPAQEPRGGVVYLQVNETPVGRLRIKGSRYFSLEQIRNGAPSLAEGKVPNFNEVARDIVSLNQMGDRKITPTLRPGVEPGTVDVDLNVKDTLPLHGSVELNNRYSANTTPLRLNGAVSYTNLWQLGHTVGFSFQVAPQNLDDAQVYSGYYIARIPGVDWVSFMVQGTRQNSNVSTLGGGAVAGNGEIVGGRILFTLPAPNTKGFLPLPERRARLQALRPGPDAGGAIDRDPDQLLALHDRLQRRAGGRKVHDRAQRRSGFLPAERWEGASKNSTTGATTPTGASSTSGATSPTLRSCPGGFQAYGQVQGQLSGEPLVDSEQFAGGGLDTVRGYLESEVLGDNALIGSFELRSPSLPKVAKIDEWRIYGFVEGGSLTLNDPLPRAAIPLPTWPASEPGAGCGCSTTSTARSTPECP